MVVQILSRIHLKKLFYSIKENPSLGQIWTQDPLYNFLQSTCYTIWGSELSHLFYKNNPKNNLWSLKTIFLNQGFQKPLGS